MGVSRDNPATGGNEAFQQPIDPSAGNLELIRTADALLANDLGLAERLCRAFLKREPRNVAAIRLLAEVGVRLGRFDEAEDLLAYCLELAPDFHLARHSFANLLFRQLRYREALIEIERILGAEPNRPMYLLLKAAILAQIGETEAAIKIYDAISNQYPGQARLHLNRGHALKTVGKQAEAVAAYRTAISMQPDLGEAYWSLSNLKTFEFDDADIVRMRAGLESSVAEQENFVHLSFALGKALEDKGEFDESYRHYSKGNAARRRTVHWDADAHHADIERIAAFFGPEFLYSRRGAGNPSPAPIFIVGLPRAGSTLLEQILASHMRSRARWNSPTSWQSPGS